MGFKGNEVTNISLEELIEKSKQYQQDIITQKELSEWANTNFIIREYIPIQEKQFAIMDICFQYEFSDYSFTELKILEAEKFKFFKCLLGLYTNIEIPTEKEKFETLCTFENYDLLSPIVEYYIYKHCSYDYDKLMKMIDNCFNYNNLKELLELLERVDSSSLEKNTMSNKKLIENLQENKELIKDISEIATLQDPSNKKLFDDFKKEFLKKVVSKSEDTEKTE